ncbi:hypothetical protein ES703_49015 [subsurface metagenome]
MIEAGKRYRTRGNSDYFKEKYGTPNPIIEIIGEDTELWKGGWQHSRAAACIIYGWRNGVELLPIEGKVYYGHEISTNLVELIHETELEPWGEEGEPPPFQGNRLDAIKNITFETSDPCLNPAVFKMAKEYAENFRWRNED